MTPQRGFTLIELAIVLVIMTILIGGLAMPLSAQIQARRIGETKKTLEEAREAILGYAMTHSADTVGRQYLPCPDTNGDGRENRRPVSNDCEPPFVGLLPWVDLGTAPQDAWGNRLHYAVVPQFAAQSTGFSASMPAAGAYAPLRICTTHTCANMVADDVVFVLVSHGPNGWGAQNMNNPPGSLQAAPIGPDETDNLDANATYVNRAPTKPDAANGEFDDLTVWYSRSQLIGLICPPGSSCNPNP